MRTMIGKIVASSLAAVALSTARPSAAMDIDLFTQPAGSTATIPNVLIVLDNSANWARNDQAWPVGKQGQAELYALRTLLADNTVINTNINLGLMMFTSGGPANGGYVRFHIRNMTTTNANALRELIGTDVDPNFGGVACPAGPNSLNGTPNCILANFNGSEKTNTAATDYSATMMDVFKYFGGYTDPPHANTDSSPNPPNVIAWNKFGNQKYAYLDPKSDPASYTGSGATSFFVSPLSSNDSCAKNYIIFIGNGYPSQDALPSLLEGVNPTDTTNLWTTNPAPIGNKNNHTANWTHFLASTDVSAVLGRQSVNTYTIDVYNAKQDMNQTALLQAMAKYGGTGVGGYYAAKSQQAILNAIKDILINIQAVNSVFASASLPINATNRTQNQNQVFIGMFRPDPDAKPRWYGNLKEYQVAMFGSSAGLADVNGNPAVSTTTGFIAPCATSFWTTDSGTYWSFSSPSAGTCTTGGASTTSDLPDGGIVEKGGVGEVLRRGNGIGTTPPFAVNRTMYTCSGIPCAGLVAFNTTNVTQAMTGASSAAENTNIVNFTYGLDVNDEDGNGVTNEPRASIHNDIVHSRPLPVNFGGTRAVELYYGANDGTFRAVSGQNGKELWSFIAPEHISKLSRLYYDSPLVSYPGLPAVTPAPTPKDFYFDGSSGLYQNADSSKVWIFPTMRRGGRMIYAFDVSAATPTFMWSRGCPNTGNDTGCSSGFSGIGLTFSTPNVAFVKGYNGGGSPVVIVGGGYDACEDFDGVPSSCTASNKGNVVYVLDAQAGNIIASFATDRGVAGDVTLIDRDFDGNVDHAYVVDIEGSLYRIDFVDPATLAARSSAAWTITKIAYTTGSNRKFLFGPAALSAMSQVYLAFSSGDRERPLIGDYPYTTPVQNRFYMFIDKFLTTGLPINLDGASMINRDTDPGCINPSSIDPSSNGWFMDLTAGRGEQSVTSSVIFGGTIFFSTNRPVASNPGSCAPNLGEARGYALNLLTGSGVIGTGSTCGGGRSGVFTGGGIPPSPVVGTVPVKQADGSFKPISVLIGGIDLSTGTGSPIGAQQPPVPIKQIRKRLFWFPEGDK